MNTVAIVGVGLIGGSFALALRKAGFTGTILGVSSPSTTQEALRLGVIDEAVILEEAAKRADLLYLAQPIQGILSTIELLGTYSGLVGLITDAGSTKVNIVRHASRYLRSEFLGGHPMAGKESRGVESADADLFRGKTYVLTPAAPDSNYTPVTGAFINWLERIGCNIVTISPEEHDRTVALTSHLPQLLSTALAATIGEQIGSSEATFQVSGSGLADTTRLALSAFDIWHDILLTNSTEISHALDLYIDKLTNIRQNLTNLQLREQFIAAAETARRVRR